MTARIGLALSGGGSRAAAFHLGCLRALHDLDLLDQVRVVSAISGGALFAATWAYGPVQFSEFDALITDLLRRGIQRQMIQQALSPASVARGAVSAGQVILPGRGEKKSRRWNRTEAFARYLDEDLFPSAHLDRPTMPGRAVVLTATDLRTGASVRFGSNVSSCSRYGTIANPVTLGTAVAASAAYPLLLPAIERKWSFTTREGSTRTETVMLSDGGIYDNLGLSVLQPGRSQEHSDHVYDVTHVILCDAGRGPLATRTPRFLLGRNTRAFEIVHAQAQNYGRGRLHEWGASGALRGFVMAYLGQRDSRLPTVVADLVPAEAVTRYPTNFAAIPASDFQALSTRGEQLTRILLPRYCPDLLG